MMEEKYMVLSQKESIVNSPQKLAAFPRMILGYMTCMETSPNGALTGGITLRKGHPTMEAHGKYFVKKEYYVAVLGMMAQ